MLDNRVARTIAGLIKRYPALAAGLVALLYYSLLMARSYTWVFVSGDSGDWLASATWWMNSQPYGSPLYVLLGRFLHLLSPGHLVLAMTWGLSVLPAAVTVAVLYLIVARLLSRRLAWVAVLVLLGAAVFLSQATILEEYAISSMFVTLAFYFYTGGQRKLTVLMLALGSAVHVIVIVISALWLLLHLREWRAWRGTFYIYAVVGLLPYSLVVILMKSNVPPLLAPHWSLAGLNNYLGATGTIGDISLWSTPQRLLQFGMVLLVTLGLALLPLAVSFRYITRQGKAYLVALVTVLFTVWLYLTDSDPSTWTFLNFSLPMIALLAVTGLKWLSDRHALLVATGAGALMIVNVFGLNAAALTDALPLATQYEQRIESLPDGSYLVCNSGGNYGLANYYVMAQGKRITPVFYTAVEPSAEAAIKAATPPVTPRQAVKIYNQAVNSPRERDYARWAGLSGNETTTMVGNLLAQGKQVYIVIPTITPYWQGVFSYVVLNSDIGRITDVKSD